jgi:hypothetical protein
MSANGAKCLAPSCGMLVAAYPVERIGITKADHVSAQFDQPVGIAS